MYILRLITKGYRKRLPSAQLLCRASV